MKNKKKRLFKILFFPISMIFCLSLFLINSFAQDGYIINSSGDIQSLNLFDINNVADGTSGNVNTSSGVVSGNDTKSVFNFQVQYITQDYNYNTIYSTDIYSPQIVSYTFTKTSDMYWLQFGHNGSSADVKVRYKIHDLVNDTYTLSINVLSITNPQSFDNIMLNVGSTALNYFPYGYYSSTSLNPFSPENISLIDFLGYGNAYDWTQLPKDNAYKYFSVQSLQIERFLNDNNINEYNTNYGRTGIEIDLINPIDLSGYHYRFNFGNGSQNGSPYQDYYIGFSRYNSTNNFIVYYTQVYNDAGDFVVDLPNNFLCDGISVFWYNVDTNRNILSQITLGSYDLGYDNGVSAGKHLGYQDGYNNGVAVGEASGYQDGYNAGVNTNLETNGMRTLFNSILSFPVDMIKSVFNFEFMGVNIASVISFIISIGIVAFVLKKFL